MGHPDATKRTVDGGRGDATSVAAGPDELWVGGSLHWGIVLLDVRTPEEHGRARIPGSAHEPLDRIRNRAQRILDRAAGRRIVVASRTGRRAARAATLLGEEGARDVQVLDGGLIAWRERGFPLERRGDDRIDRQARVVTGVVATASLLLGLLSSPLWLLAASASVTAVILEGARDTSLFAPLLAGMPWNRGNDPLRAPDSLTEAEAHGEPRDTEVRRRAG